MVGQMKQRKSGIGGIFWHARAGFPLQITSCFALGNCVNHIKLCLISVPFTLSVMVESIQSKNHMANPWFDLESLLSRELSAQLICIPKERADSSCNCTEMLVLIS